MDTFFKFLESSAGVSEVVMTVLAVLIGTVIRKLKLQNLDVAQLSNLLYDAKTRDEQITAQLTSLDERVLKIESDAASGTRYRLVRTLVKINETLRLQLPVSVSTVETLDSVFDAYVKWGGKGAIVAEVEELRERLIESSEEIRLYYKRDTTV